MLPALLRFVRPLWILALAVGSVVIAAGSFVYFDAGEIPPFVIEKLPLPMEDLWLFTLRAHVVAAAIALPACLILGRKTMLRRPRAHRWLGRVTGAVVLLALVPSGLYLSLFAKGGLPATAGFALSGLIAAAAMVRGIGAARAGDFAAHRRASLHVLAQLSVAVTSRALLFVLDAAAVDPDGAYLFSLWAPVLGSAAFVEIHVPRPSQRRSHEAVARAVDAVRNSPGLGHAA
jgi:uncharacterized membrane protein